MYYTMYCLGAIAAVLTVVFRYKQYNAPPVRATIMETIVVIVAVLSGKFVFGFEELLYGNSFSIDGIRIYGLIISVPLMCLLLHEFSNLRWIEALSLCTPGLAMSSTFARIGCYYAGCCGGPPILVGGKMIDIPEQLIEGALDLAMFCLLLHLEKKQVRNLLYPIYLLLYAIIRFALDFLRDSPRIFLNLTLAQGISILAILISVVWIVLSLRIDNVLRKENR